jgi:glycine/D-amino acid oxidase-like deaminating enzyme/nitrite reductase/ring-hydroxylating ferredoxin subunit
MKRGDLHSVGKAESVWVDTTPTTNYPTLNKELKVDVLVVGGGITGINCAYLLQAEGKKVAVIDRDRIVSGVTGYTTAKLTSLHDVIYDHLIKSFGEDKAKLYWEANETAIDLYESISKKEKINCDFKRVSAYTFTSEKKNVKQIEKEIEAAKKLGIPAKYYEQLPIPFQVEAAVEFPKQARFHPRKFLLALADRFIKKGGYIFENTRAIGLEEGEPCKVETDKGSILAKKVIMASHYPFHDKAMYFSRLVQIRSYVLGIQVKDKVPDGMYIGLEPPYYTLRKVPTDKGEIIIFGGQDHKSGQEPDTIDCYKKLEKAAHTFFDIKKILFHWSTQDAVTPDKVPYIGLHTPRSKHVYVATGFNEWGMAHGMVAGVLLKDLIMRRKNPWQELYDPNRFKPVAQGPKLIKENVNVAKEILSGYLSSMKKEVLSSVKKGKARVITIDKEKVAVYRDEKNSIHAVSAVCTHMGCIVNWNNAEKSWDCPCHGSRFSYKGKVVQGPAVKDLKKKNI